MLLLKLAEGLEQDLGLVASRLAIVIHGARRTEGLIRYDLSLGSDDELIGAMRKAFPYRGTGHFSVRLGKLGGLDLFNVAAADVEAAIVRAEQARRLGGGSI